MKASRLLLLLPLLTPVARAHFVWLERTAEGPAAFFGEWVDNLRENQDGYLKIVGAPRAIASDGAELTVTRRHDRLAIAATASTDLRLSAHYRPEKGETFIRYHARLGRSDTSPARLDLELVPVSPAANAFTLVFQGQPLPGTDVTLFSATGWSRKFRSTADGRVSVETPWPGAYVLEVSHLDKTPGEHEGRAHQSVRHVSTLRFETAAAR